MSVPLVQDNQPPCISLFEPGNHMEQTTCARALETAALTSNQSAREAAQPHPHPQLLEEPASETVEALETDAFAV